MFGSVRNKLNTPKRILSTQDVDKYVNKVESRLNSPLEKKSKSFAFARMYYDAKDYDLAKKYLDDYISVQDRDFRVHNLMGEINEALNNNEEALTSFKRSLELCSTQKDILIKVVTLTTKCSIDPMRAKVWADKGAKFCPGNPAVFELKWHLLTQQSPKDFEEMESLLADELSRRARDASLHIKLVDLYTETGSHHRAYMHCQSVEKTAAFNDDVDWLQCACDVFNSYRKQKEGIAARLCFVLTLCKLTRLHLKLSSSRKCLPVLQSFDEYLFELKNSNAVDTRLSFGRELTDSLKEMTGQLYLNVAIFFMKLADEGSLSWMKANQLMCVCLMNSWSVEAPAMTQKLFGRHSPLKKNNTQTYDWSVLACDRLSQAGHLILTIESQFNEEWIKGCLQDFCNQKGQSLILEELQIQNADISYLANDESFLSTDIDIPDPHDLVKYDEVSVAEHAQNLHLIIWLGLHWDKLNEMMKPGVGVMVGRLFEGIAIDVKNMTNCHFSNLCLRDVEAFIYGVIRSSKSIYVEGAKDEDKLQMLPMEITPTLITIPQEEWWKSAYGLYTGKIGTQVAAKLKVTLQKGLETIRCLRDHGIDPRILVYIATAFWEKAQSIDSAKKTEYDYQDHWESLQRRAVYYMKEAIRILEIFKRNKTIPVVEHPLILPLLNPLMPEQIETFLASCYLKIAESAMLSGDLQDALKYYEEVNTLHSMYSQVQIYDRLRSQCNLDTVEGEKDHLYYTKKAIEKVNVCISNSDHSSEFTELLMEQLRELQQGAVTPALNQSFASSKKCLDFKAAFGDIDDEKEFKLEDMASSVTADDVSNIERSILQDQLNAKENEVETLRQHLEMYKAHYELQNQQQLMMQAQYQSAMLTPIPPHSGMVTPQSMQVTTPHGIMQSTLNMQQNGAIRPTLPAHMQGTDPPPYVHPHSGVPQPQSGVPVNPRMVHPTLPMQPSPIPQIHPGSAIPLQHYPQVHNISSQVNGVPGQIPSIPDQVHGVPAQIHIIPGQIPSTPGQIPSVPGQIHSIPGQVGTVQPVVGAIPIHVAQGSQHVQVHPVSSDGSIVVTPTVRNGIETPTDMWWDSFSPQPSFEKGYFAGLAEHVEQSREELGEEEAPTMRDDDALGSPTPAEGEVGTPGSAATTPKIEHVTPKKTSIVEIDDIYVEPIVKLESKSDIITGEEDETIKFTSRAKLYRFDKEAGQWKERGIGEVKILLDESTNKSRITMRRDQVFRLCCNHNITSEMSLDSKAGAKAAWSWFTAADASETQVRPEQFTIKFKTQDIADNFKEMFTLCQKLANNSPIKVNTDVTSKPKEVINDADKAKTLAAKFAPKTGTWACETCLINNEVDTVKCVACQSVKPGYTDLSSSSAPESITTTNPDGGNKFGGFSFGAAQPQPFGASQQQPTFGTKNNEPTGFSFGQQNATFGQQPITFGQPNATFGQQPIAFGQQNTPSSIIFGQQSQESTHTPVGIPTDKSNVQAKIAFDTTLESSLTNSSSSQSTPRLPATSDAVVTSAENKLFQFKIPENAITESPEGKPVFSFATTTSVIPKAPSPLVNPFLASRQQIKTVVDELPPFKLGGGGEDKEEKVEVTDDTTTIKPNPFAGFSFNKTAPQAISTASQQASKNTVTATETSSSPFSGFSFSSKDATSVVAPVIQTTPSSSPSKSSEFPMMKSLLETSSASNTSPVISGMDTLPVFGKGVVTTGIDPTSFWSFGSPQKPFFTGNTTALDSIGHKADNAEAEEVNDEGNENEIVKFQGEASLARYDNEADMWEVLGFGVAKILLNLKTLVSRIEMHDGEPTNLLCNHYVTFDLSLNSVEDCKLTWTYYTDSDTMVNQEEIEHLKIKFSTEQDAESFKNIVIVCQELIDPKANPNWSGAGPRVMDELEFFNGNLEASNEEGGNNLYEGDGYYYNETTGQIEYDPNYVGNYGEYGDYDGEYESEEDYDEEENEEYQPSSGNSSRLGSNDPIEDLKDNSKQVEERFEIQKREQVQNQEDVINDEVIITYHCKPSFQQKLKASRLQLPQTFYLYQSKENCSGCRGCIENYKEPAVEILTVEDVSKATTVTTSVIMPTSNINETLKSNETSSKIFGSPSPSLPVFGVTTNKDNQSPSSFATLSGNSGFNTGSGFGAVAGVGQNDGFSGSSGAFSGAGAQLFSAGANNETNENDNEHDPHYDAIVSISKLEDYKTGEEDDVAVFKHRGKIYRFDQQWKERGVGDIKLTKNLKTGYCRVIMRRDAVHKICANHAIMPNMELKPLFSSDKSWIWFTPSDYSEGLPPVPEQFCIKFKYKETADEFKQHFEELQKLMDVKLKEDALKESQEAKKEESAESSLPDSDLILEKPVSFASKFALKEGQWECSTCLVRNEATFSKCVACRTKNPNSTDSEKPVSFASKFALKEGQWECSTCLVRNEPTFSKCVACQTKNPNSTDSEKPVSFASKFALIEGQWECSTCLVRNEATSSKCVACQTKNPNSGDAGNDSSSISFGNNDSGFTFGSQSNNTSQTASPFTFGNSNNTAPMFGNKPNDNPFGFSIKPTTDSPFAMKPTSDSPFTIKPTSDSPFAMKSTSDSPFASKSNNTPFSFGAKSSTDSPFKFGTPSNDTPSSFDVKASTDSPFKFGTPSTDTPSTAVEETSGEKEVSPFKFGATQFTNDSPFTFNVPQEEEEEPTKPVKIVKEKETVKVPVSPSKYNDDDEPDIHVDAIVQVSKLEKVTTGEEDDETIFTNRSKLFRFDATNKAWKERGIGEMKLTRNKITNSCRVLMRREQIFKLCANHVIVPLMELKPLAKSDKSWTWFTQADFSDEEGKPEQFCAKFKTSEIANEFKDAFTKCQEYIKTKVIPKDVIVEENKKASGFAKFAPAKGSWDCTTCLLVNKPNTDKCAACETKNPAVTKTTSDPKPPITDTTIAQPATTQKFTNFSKFAPQPGSWVCQTCLINNKPDATNCAACDTRNPDATEDTTKPVPAFGGSAFGAQSQDASGFSFGNSNQPSSGFSFGNQSSNNAGFSFGNSNSNDQTGITFGTKQDKPTPFSFGNQSNAGFSFGTSSQTSEPDQNKSNAFGLGVQPETKPIAAKEDPTVKTIPKSFTSDPDAWQCASCLARNNSDREVCRVVSCSAPRMKTPNIRLDPDQFSAPINFSENNTTTPTPPIFAPIANPASESPFGGGAQGPTYASATSFSFGNQKSESAGFSFGQSILPTPDLSNYEKEMADRELMPPPQNLPSIKTKVSPKQNAKNDSIFNWMPKGLSTENLFSFGATPTPKILSAASSVDDIAGVPSIEVPSAFSSSSFSFQLDSVESTTDNVATPVKSPLKSTVVSPVVQSPSGLEEESAVEFTPLVSLVQVEKSTGEESEEILFCERTKMFRFHGSQWKERGVGELKVLKHKQTKQSRVIMRRDQTHKLGANHGLVSGMTIKPMNGNVKAYVWKTMADTSDDQVKEEMFAARFKNEEIANNFAKIFRDVCENSEISEISTSPPGPSGEQVNVKEKQSGNEVAVSKTSDVIVISDDEDERKDILPEGVEITYERKNEDEELKNKAISMLLPSTFYIQPTVNIGEQRPQKTVALSSTSYEKADVFTSRPSDKTQYKDVDAVSSNPNVRVLFDDVGEILKGTNNDYTHVGNGHIKVVYDKVSNISHILGASENGQVYLEHEISTLEVEVHENSKVIAIWKLYSNDEIEYNGRFTSILSLERFLESIVNAKELEQKKAVKESKSPSTVFKTAGLSSFASLAAEGTSNFQSNAGKSFATSSSELFQSDGTDEVREGDIYFEPIVQLSANVEVSTGEENEQSVFRERSKMYKFDSTGKKWKERGVGDIKLLINRSTSKARLIMRRDQTRKLCANHFLHENMELNPFPTNDLTVTWNAVGDVSDGEPSDGIFAAKFKNESLLNDFKQTFTALCKGTYVPPLKDQDNDNSEDGKPLFGACDPKLSKELNSLSIDEK